MTSKTINKAPSKDGLLECIRNKKYVKEIIKQDLMLNGINEFNHNTI